MAKKIKKVYVLRNLCFTALFTCTTVFASVPCSSPDWQKYLAPLEETLAGDSIVSVSDSVDFVYTPPGVDENKQF